VEALTLVNGDARIPIAVLAQSSTKATMQYSTMFDASQSLSLGVIVSRIPTALAIRVDSVAWKVTATLSADGSESLVQRKDGPSVFLDSKSLAAWTAQNALLRIDLELRSKDSLVAGSARLILEAGRPASGTATVKIAPASNNTNGTGSSPTIDSFILSVSGLSALPQPSGLAAPWGSFLQYAASYFFKSRPQDSDSAAVRIPLTLAPGNATDIQIMLPPTLQGSVQVLIEVFTRYAACEKLCFLAAY
jgi:hypothetical protein